MAELQSLSNDEPRIVDDSLKFKMKLSIGDEAYAILNNAENLTDFLKAMGGGIGFTSLTTLGWYAGLGTLSKVALGFGIISSPVGWIFGAGALGIISTYALIHASKKINKKKESIFFDRIPKYLKTPLDILGLSIISAILPPAIKIAKSDSKLCTREYDVMCSYFVDGWGFNKEFIKSAIKEQELLNDNFDYDIYVKALIDATRENTDIKYDVLEKEIIFILNEIMNADGTIGQEELNELDLLAKTLSKYKA